MVQRALADGARGACKSDGTELDGDLGFDGITYTRYE